MSRTANRVVVLGGSGWVGKHVCSEFERRGAQVTVVGRNRGAVREDLTFSRLDLAKVETAEILALLERVRPDVVVNATDGANATDGWSRADKQLCRMNVSVVRRLISAVGALSWRPRLLHIGTVHEYGPVPYGTLVHEGLSPRPDNVYTRTKLAGSECVLDAAHAGVVDATVVRLANVCGAHPSPATFLGKLVQRFRDALPDERVDVTIANAHRDFVDVGDVAEAIWLAATANVSGRVINIGSGLAIGIGDLVRRLAAVVERLVDLAQHAGDVASLGGDWTQVDTRLAEATLGWRSRTPLDESLRAMWATRDLV